VPLHLRRPEPDHLEAIVRAHLGELDGDTKRIITTFLERSSTGELATDQLLNAIYLSRVPGLEAGSRDALAARRTSGRASRAAAAAAGALRSLVHALGGARCGTPWYRGAGGGRDAVRQSVSRPS
jgi:hypothetical protein